MYQIRSHTYFLQVTRQHSEGQGFGTQFVQQALRRMDTWTSPEFFAGSVFEAMAPPSDDEENNKVNATG